MARRGLGRYGSAFGNGGVFGIWWFKWAFVGILAATAVTLVVVLVVEQHYLEQSAQAESARYVPPSPNVTTAPAPFVVDVIGDSYTGCSEMGGCADKNYTVKLAADLGWTFHLYAVGGTGYVNPPTDKSLIFGARVGKVLADHPDMVIVEGSRNDAFYPTQVGSVAHSVLEQLRKGLPKTSKLVAWGPMMTQNSDVTGTLAARDAIKKAQSGVADLWIDPIQDRWFQGADAKYIGTDETHPTDAGHIYMAEKLEPLLKPLGP